MRTVTPLSAVIWVCPVIAMASVAAFVGLLFPHTVISAHPGQHVAPVSTRLGASRSYWAGLVSDLAQHPVWWAGELTGRHRHKVLQAGAPGAVPAPVFSPRGQAPAHPPAVRPHEATSPDLPALGREGAL